LAGYADGELGPAERAAVESWLAAHPEARAELDAQRQLGRQNVVFWQKVTIPHPGESAWQRSLGQVRGALQPATPSLYYADPEPTSRGRSWRRWALAFTATAAAVVATWSWVEMPRGGDPAGAVVASENHFDVVRPDEVEIVSHQGDDALIVVGRPLLSGNLELVTVGDMIFEAISNDPDARPTKPHTVPTDPKRPIFITPTDKTVPVAP